MLLQKT